MTTTLRHLHDVLLRHRQRGEPDPDRFELNEESFSSLRRELVSSLLTVPRRELVSGLFSGEVFRVFGIPVVVADELRGGVRQSLPAGENHVDAVDALTMPS
ncbi:MAG TPA: hypothetical protein VJP07_09380, partial [Dehalococcoidia bacterium]|nr:hypothetical protein [Dehalococcoidia bacterium]